TGGRAIARRMPCRDDPPQGRALILPLRADADGGVSACADLALHANVAGHVDIDRHAALLRRGAGLDPHADAVADRPREADRRSAIGAERDVEAVDAERAAKPLEHALTAVAGELRGSLRELKRLRCGEAPGRLVEEDAGEDFVLRQVRV